MSLFDGKEQRKKYKPRKPIEHQEYEEHEDNDTLNEEAQRAVLIKQIKEAELMTFKSDREEIALRKAAGDLIEKDLAEFLFLGYLEKLNTDLIQLTKRNEARLENLIKERDFKGVVRLINNEIRAIIIEVKKSQKEEVTKWESQL